MTDNMGIYNAAKDVPQEAKKPIKGGKLNGMTDINPMWRIRKLTELFGPCGIGWKTTAPRYWVEPGANGEILAYCETGLQYKKDGEWSAPVMGVGGSKAVMRNKNGLESSDEAYKMAYTDALSVCCKLLGMGASVYWERGETKYSLQAEQEKVAAERARAKAEAAKADAERAKEEQADPVYCDVCCRPILDYAWASGRVTSAGILAKRTKEKTGMCMCGDCYTQYRAEHGN